MTNEVINILGILLSSCIIESIVTHLLYRNKVRKERKGSILSKEIEKSLKRIRKMELMIKREYTFVLEEEMEIRKYLSVDNCDTIYPHIFDTWETYEAFLHTISLCRQYDEQNVSSKIALNLLYIEKYMEQLTLFMERHVHQSISLWGTVFYYDLSKWQKRFDKMIVKEMNKYPDKLQIVSEKRYAKMRKREIEKQYKQTILHYLMSGECKRSDRKLMNQIKMLMG